MTYIAGERGLWYNMSVKAKEFRAFSVSSGMVLQANILVGKTPLSSRINVRFLGLDNLEKTTWRRFAMVKLTDEERRLRVTANTKKYRATHPERVAISSKVYRESHKKQRKAYDEAHREEIRERRRLYDQEHIEQVRESGRRYYQKHRAKRVAAKATMPILQIRAGHAINNAIRKGELIPPVICQSCGCEPFPAHDGRRTIEAHHHLRYEREHWFDVQWLCSSCHKREDNTKQ